MREDVREGLELAFSQLEEPSQRHQLVIGDRRFPSKAAAREYVLDLKHHRLDELIEGEDPDFLFLLGLLTRLPRWPSKVEHPPAFVARLSEIHIKTTELRFVDALGREVDFSAEKCIRADSLAKDVTRSLRNAMQQAVQPSFKSHPKTKAWQFRNEDKAFAAAWCKYHDQHAALRLLCGSCAEAVNRERQLAREAAQHDAAAAGEP
ncbi:hypothetical protein N2152v2_000406 [Parachlorella kessleri]